jgi:hypothetical protein
MVSLYQGMVTTGMIRFIKLVAKFHITLNAKVAQPKNFLFGINTAIELKI